MREELKELAKDYDKSENDLKALQSVGQVQIRIDYLSFFTLVLIVGNFLLLTYANEYVKKHIIGQKLHHLCNGIG